jgi:hypothetical protein
MDRRYSQARGASRSSSRRSDAYARANLARARIGVRSARAVGRNPASSSISGRGDANMARAAERQERSRIFDQEGSGVFGAGSQALQRREEIELPREGLL